MEIKPLYLCSFFLTCSAYVFAKTRLFSRRDSDIHNTIANKKRKYEHCDESEISTPYDNYSSEQNLVRFLLTCISFTCGNFSIM